MNDYGELVKLGKKNNPKLFNDPKALKKEFKETEEELEKMKDPVARIITVQTRNVLACALGIELLSEEPYVEAVKEKYKYKYKYK